MGMQIRIEAPLTLADLRQLVDQTSTWPPDCEVTPRGSTAIVVDRTNPTVEEDDVVTEVRNGRIGG